MKTICTWGYGPDVLLSLEGTSLVLGESPDLDKNRWPHGVVTKGEVDLTADQAHELGFALMNAAQQVKELEESIPKEESNEKRNSGHDR